MLRKKILKFSFSTVCRAENNWKPLQPTKASLVFRNYVERNKIRKDFAFIQNMESSQPVDDVDTTFAYSCQCWSNGNDVDQKV